VCIHLVAFQPIAWKLARFRAYTKMPAQGSIKWHLLAETANKLKKSNELSQPASHQPIAELQHSTRYSVTHMGLKHHAQLLPELAKWVANSIFEQMA